MKILLTHGYFIKEDKTEQKIMKPYPPLGILYLSAYLDKQGIDNEVFDSTFSSMLELKNYLLQSSPDYLAIYVNLMTKINVLQIVEFVNSSSRLENTKIILGGPDIRYNAEEFLKNGAHYLVIGEGEESFYELINVLESVDFKALKNVKGIGYKDEIGNPVLTDERVLIENINTLPLPSRNKIDLTQYQTVWRKHHNSDAISLSTMRGCPYTCKWCSRAVYGLSYRRRSPKNVADEIQLIVDEYNPDALWFVDDVFTINYGWIREFEQELRFRNLKIKYECITRADRMNEEIISLLKNSGCFRVWIGAESGSQRILDAMDRRVRVDQVREMIQMSKKFGIEIGTFIMLGYPGETEKDIEETINHLKESNPDHFTITIAYPIKGTDLFTEIESNQIKDFNWELNTDRDRDFKRTYSSKYYNYAVRRVVNEVKFHQQSNNKLIKLKPLKYKFKSMIAKGGMWWTRNL